MYIQQWGISAIEYRVLKMNKILIIFLLTIASVTAYAADYTQCIINPNDPTDCGCPSGNNINECNCNGKIRGCPGNCAHWLYGFCHYSNYESYDCPEQATCDGGTTFNCRAGFIKTGNKCTLDETTFTDKVYCDPYGCLTL